MKSAFAFVLLFLCGSAFAADQPDPSSGLAIVHSLAERPLGVVIGDKCEIRGAVWAYGPRPGVRMALIDVQSMAVYGATTAASGVYSLSIPYHGKPVILQERIADQIYALQNISKDVQVLDGGVICDHRLQSQLTSNSNKEATR